jgi:hypothetical protein
MPRATVANGYGAAHKRLRRQWASRVAAGGVDCARCGQPIVPGSPWDSIIPTIGRPISARLIGRATGPSRARSPGSDLGRPTCRASAGCPIPTRATWSPVGLGIGQARSIRGAQIVVGSPARVRSRNGSRRPRRRGWRNEARDRADQARPAAHPDRHPDGPAGARAGRVSAADSAAPGRRNHQPSLRRSIASSRRTISSRRSRSSSRSYDAARSRRSMNRSAAAAVRIATKPMPTTMTITSAPERASNPSHRRSRDESGPRQRRGGPALAYPGSRAATVGGFGRKTQLTGWRARILVGALIRSQPEGQSEEGGHIGGCRLHPIRGWHRSR